MVKKKSKKKSQNKLMVMDFLMTYGWAILVVLVAIFALARFGILSPESFMMENSRSLCMDYCEDKDMKMRYCDEVGDHDLQVVCEKPDKQCVPYMGGEAREIACIDFTRQINITLQEVMKMS